MIWRRVLLWLMFFFTTFVLSGALLLFGLVYWLEPLKSFLPKVGPFGYTILIWWYPAAVAGLFSLIYATYKVHSLKCVEIRLSTSDVDPDWVEERLVALGYLPDRNGGVYRAGFRADYWMAPDISVRKQDGELVLFGPSFYLRKIAKAARRRKWLQKAKSRLRGVRKGRHEEDSTPMS